MLRFLQSVFGGNAATGKHDRALVNRALERAVDGTDPCIRAVSGYRKKLRPAVERSIDHVVAEVASMAPPIVLDPAAYDVDPLLRTFFYSAQEIRTFLADDPALTEFKEEHRLKGGAAHALLVMEKQEKKILGVELSGEIVMRDVPQLSVSFREHRLVDLSAGDEQTRRLIKRRAYDHLLKLALGRLTHLKGERGKLERHRALLRSKLDLLQREGWGFEKGKGEGHHDIPAVERELDRIERQLLKVGGDDRLYEAYLGAVAEVLADPGAYLWGAKETLALDRMGIRRCPSSGAAPEVTLDMIYNAEGRSLAVSLVTIPG